MTGSNRSRVDGREGIFLSCSARPKMASKTLLRTGASFLSRAVNSGLTPKSSNPNGRIWLSRNLGLHQNDADSASNLNSEELFFRSPCGIPSLRFFLPNVNGSSGKKLEDESFEDLERASISNQVFLHPCGVPSLEFFLPDVLRILDLNIPVLASIPIPKQGRNIPGVARVRNHPRATIYTLTPSNRDTFSERIYSQLADLAHNQSYIMKRCSLCCGKSLLVL